MVAQTFKSPHEVNLWLSDKPVGWKKIIYTRSALRALPTMARTSEDWLKFHSVSLFQANLTAWVALNYQDIDIYDLSELSGVALQQGLRRAYDDSIACEAIFIAQSAILQIRGKHAGDSFNWRDDLDQHSPGTVATLPALSDLMKAVADDCHWLLQNDDLPNGGLSWFTLWLGEPQLPVNRRNEWPLLRETLLRGDPNYSVWIDWYERRIRGERAAFDIPGDKGRVEDKKILRRLAEATDEDFWGKGHEYVNATLKGWLDEARARVAPPPIVAEASSNLDFTLSAHAELGPLPSPPQDPGAIAYGINDQGKLDRLPNSDQVHLRDVPDQRRAYEDIREAATELLAEGQRLGHRLQRALDRFLHSLPERFEDAEAYLVWRDANALRRLHRAHREAATTPEPDEAKLEPVIAEGLGGLLDLYNNFAFADDGLRAKDEARIAPQERASAEVEAKAAAPLIEAILATPDISSPQARDDIAVEVENIRYPSDDPYAGQVLAQSNRTISNYVAGLLSGVKEAASNPKKVGIALTLGSIGKVGEATTGAILSANYAPLFEFIATNAAALQFYVAVACTSFPHLPDLVARIVAMWNRLKHGDTQ
jgi:hypothetical protein